MSASGPWPASTGVLHPDWVPNISPFFRIVPSEIRRCIVGRPDKCRTQNMCRSHSDADNLSENFHLRRTPPTDRRIGGRDARQSFVQFATPWSRHTTCASRCEPVRTSHASRKTPAAAPDSPRGRPSCGCMPSLSSALRYPLLAFFRLGTGKHGFRCAACWTQTKARSPRKTHDSRWRTARRSGLERSRQRREQACGHRQ